MASFLFGEGESQSIYHTFVEKLGFIVQDVFYYAESVHGKRRKTIQNVNEPRGSFLLYRIRERRRFAFDATIF